ncbi:hypothetical protein L198_00375 [Cryptococcus wingfieldii CBS 7118]|uniref:Uncharacterized protein n=1 Tax=Cryptococcus wingfieldii CBS 7118 TaxID=1295528 RepID=A0A1E3K707_9TREE|nr:hypothetical protein L198_00375 [Cryptococcus wingfieldii CBS 7118]ODO08643.1 hypothetical protein L198_00375 [Cryptococcus wingfieldii CBS 7118]
MLHVWHDSVLSDAGKQTEYGLTTSFSSLNLTSEEPTIPISSFAAPLQLAVLVLAVRRHNLHQAGTPAEDPAWKNASVKPESLSAVSPSDLNHMSKLVLDMFALAKQRGVAASSAGRLQRAIRGRNDAESQLATKSTQLETTHSMLERAVVKMGQDGTTPEDIAVHIAMPLDQVKETLLRFGIVV